MQTCTHGRKDREGRSLPLPLCGICAVAQSSSEDPPPEVKGKKPPKTDAEREREARERCQGTDYAQTRIASGDGRKKDAPYFQIPRQLYAAATPTGDGSTPITFFGRFVSRGKDSILPHFANGSQMLPATWGRGYVAEKIRERKGERIAVRGKGYEIRIPSVPELGQAVLKLAEKPRVARPDASLEEARKLRKAADDARKASVEASGIAPARLAQAEARAKDLATVRVVNSKGEIRPVKDGRVWDLKGTRLKGTKGEIHYVGGSDLELEQQKRRFAAPVDAPRAAEKAFSAPIRTKLVAF